MRAVVRCALLLSGSFHAGLALAQPASTGPAIPPPPSGMPAMPAMPTMAETTYASALQITDGKISVQDSQLVRGKRATATAGEALSIQASRDGFNGVIVQGGRSAYSLANSKIALTGTGKNDFLGIGAGVMARDSATLVLDRVEIVTNGPVAPAVVAAEGATLRIYDSRLVANGGKLPATYKPIIGPGMMEPPSPLGLSGNARTLLAMTNSRTYLYRTTIEADGWGALSTDQSGGDLYLEANDCTVLVRNRGYGVYADFGAHVVVNRGRIDSGAYHGIIAGAARLEFNGTSGRAHDSAVMIHSVMGINPAETGLLSLSQVTLESGGPLLLVKSANAAITINGGSLRSDSGVLLEVRRNDDANATKVNGQAVPGVRLTINGAELRGDIIDTDPERRTYVNLSGTKLAGALNGVTLSADANSRWTARADSEIWLDGPVGPGIIDAPGGVTVKLHPPAGPGGPPDKEFKLPGGGRILIVD